MKQLDLIADLLGDGASGLLASLASLSDQIEWGEDEINKATQRHPHAVDTLYHSFPLLRGTSDRMSTEFVYRAHARELLDRVAPGGDTRPGTAAEVCCAMLQASLLAPLRSSAMGLYMRMWQAAGFPEIDGFAEGSRHHEALEASTIDDHERLARHKLAVPDRRLGTIECSGLHHGDRVACTYA